MAIAREKVGITKLKKDAAEIVRRVRDGREEFVITVDGKPVARISPWTEEMSGDEFNREIRAWLKSIEPLAREISAVWPKGVSAADAVAEQRR